jgi:hypothetical protein
MKKLYALVIHLYESHVHVSLHRSAEEAYEAGAVQCLKLIMEDSSVDLGDNPNRMTKAMREKNHDLVIRFFEGQKNRRCVFVSETTLPS